MVLGLRHKAQWNCNHKLGGVKCCLWWLPESTNLLPNIWWLISGWKVVSSFSRSSIFFTAIIQTTKLMNLCAQQKGSDIKSHYSRTYFWEFTSYGSLWALFYGTHSQTTNTLNQPHNKIDECFTSFMMCQRPSNTTHKTANKCGSLPYTLQHFFTSTTIFSTVLYTDNLFSEKSMQFHV